MTAPALSVRPRTTPLNLDPGRVAKDAGPICWVCWHRTGHVVAVGGRLYGGGYVCTHTIRELSPEDRAECANEAAWKRHTDH